MKIMLIVCALLLLLMTIRYILYRRQICDLCRQLQFIMYQNTNSRLHTDLTERELLNMVNIINQFFDEQDRKNITMRKREKALKGTLASLSHDIRTPLTSLKGYFTLLMTEQDKDKAMAYTKVMQERMDTLSDLLEELFTYTKLANEDYELELSEMDFTRLMFDAIFSFYEIFQEKGIRLELDVDDKSRILSLNEVAVKRIVSNILKNAMSHGEGWIKVIYGENEKGELVFTCLNTISEPEKLDIDQIFERFYKADSARSKNSTGLGLAITKELTERMGGNVSVGLEKNIFKISVIFKK